MIAQVNVRPMKKNRVCFVWMALSCCSALHAQPLGASSTAGLSAAAVTADRYAFKPDSSTDLGFRPIAPVVHAEGSGRVRTRDEVTEISAKINHMPAPSSFGPFAAYVLWTVTPEGRAVNVGAFSLDGEKASLNASTPLSSFALVVTAEPDFAVTLPSRCVVLESIVSGEQGSSVSPPALASQADYTSLKPLPPPDPKQRTPAELDMARYAVAIAETVKAGEFAPASLQVARDSLKAAEDAQLSKSSADREHAASFARIAVQAAEDARAAAEAKGKAAEFERLRQQLGDTEAKAKKGAEESAAREAALKLQLTQSESALQEAQAKVPNRMLQANTLLKRWLVVNSDERSITAYVPSDDFNKIRTDLTQESKTRLATAIGILLGIGDLSVGVAPQLPPNEDAKQQGLSRQRALAMQEWLKSLGVNVREGTPAPAPAAVERTLAPGPGVELQISFDEPASADTRPQDPSQS